MERHHKILAIVLAVQLLIVAAVWFYESDREAPGSQRLLTFDPAQVTAIEIDDRTDTIRLERGADGWVLPAVDGLPADGSKVSGLLEKLEQADAPWPVTTSESSAARFEVTDDKYQRRVRLLNGDTTLAALYLGTSPGFRKVHARVEGATDVYAISFANYEAPTKPEEWLDKALLQPRGAVQSLSRRGAYTVSQQDGAWALTDAQPDETLNQDTVRDLVAKFANLRVLGLAESPPAPDAAPKMQFDVKVADGDLSLSVYRSGDEGDFVVGSDRYPSYFRVSEYVGEGISVDRPALLVPAAAAAAPAEAQ
jgi:hypothetical protein